MAIPSMKKVMRPILELLNEKGELTERDIVDAMANKFNLTDEKRVATVSSNTEYTLIKDRVHWAAVHMKAAGLVEYEWGAPRKITAEGGELVQKIAGTDITLDTKYLSENYESYRPNISKKQRR